MSLRYTVEDDSVSNLNPAVRVTANLYHQFTRAIKALEKTRAVPVAASYSRHLALN